MKIDISGLRELENRLEIMLSPYMRNKVYDKALLEASKPVEKAIRENFQEFKDTGSSINEITVSKPFTEDGRRLVSIHWEGEKNRYKIIHLNEFGTVKNPNPRGKGALERAVRQSSGEFYKILLSQIKNEIATNKAIKKKLGK